MMTKEWPWTRDYGQGCDLDSERVLLDLGHGQRGRSTTGSTWIATLPPAQAAKVVGDAGRD
jgi:hypothetical protein